MGDSNNISYKWVEGVIQSQFIIIYKNFIGEKEANELLKILSKLKDHDKVIKLNIYLIDVEIFTPVFISNLFLIANHKNSKGKSDRFQISIYLPYEDAITYSFSHITGLLGHSFFTDKINIFREDKSIPGEYVKYEPRFVISDRFLPSLYLNKVSFQLFFQKIYQSVESTQENKSSTGLSEQRDDMRKKTEKMAPKGLPTNEEFEIFKNRAKNIVYEKKQKKDKEESQIMKIWGLLSSNFESHDAKIQLLQLFTEKFKSHSRPNVGVEKIIVQFPDELEKKIASQYVQGKSANEIEKIFDHVKKKNKKLDAILAYELAKVQSRSIESEEIILIKLVSVEYNFNGYNLKKIEAHEAFTYYSITLIDEIMTLVNYAEKKSYLYKQLINSEILYRILNRPLFFIILYRLIFINTTSFSSRVDQSKFGVRLNRVQLLKTDKELANDERERINSYCEHVEKVYYFIDSVYQGIYELAKNVIEHSSNNHGILNIRLFDFHNIAKIKNNNTRWENYFKLLREEISSKNDFLKKIIDISITDDGEKGIIDTRNLFLLNIIPKIKSNDEDKKIFKQEADLNEEPRVVNYLVNHLNDPKEFTSIFYNHYFNIRIRKQFATMYKKMLGGYGLKIFSANVEDNYGCYTCRSFSQKAKSLSNMSYDFMNFFNDNFSVINSNIDIIGTHYNFVFPIVYKKIREFRVAAPIERLTVGEDVLVLLDSYSFSDNETELKYSDKLEWGKDSHEAYFYYFEHQIKSNYPEGDIIPVYDFGSNNNDSIEIDRSAFLRFMAEKAIFNKYEHPYFVVINVQRQVLEGLLDLLLVIHKYFDKNTFWSDKTTAVPSSMIFYRSESPNIISDGDNGTISCILLAGKDVNEFIAVNNILSYYQFASIPLYPAFKSLFDINKNVNIDYLLKSPFFNMSQPILFDLLIKIRLLKKNEDNGDVKITVFENNVHRLLTTEISSNYDTI